MLKRVVTGAVLFVIMFVALYFQGWALRGLLLAAMLLSMYEMYHAFQKSPEKPIRWVGYLFCLLAVGAEALNASLASPVFHSVNPPMFALVVSLILALSAIVLRGKVAFHSLVATVFPLLYPGILFALIVTLQDLHSQYTSTIALILTFFLASVNDIFALFVGLRFGKHRLSPEISPKKSVEGSIGGLAASVVFAVLVPLVANALTASYPQINPTSAVLPPLWAFALLGLAAGALSQIGDLVASLIKRFCGIKDYGNIFPGHGGVMDRMDGILFCGAAYYLFFHLTGI